MTALRASRPGGARFASLTLTVAMAVAGCLLAGASGLAGTASARVPAPYPLSSSVPTDAAQTSAATHDAVAPPSPDHSFRIAVVSDLNSSYGSLNYGKSVHAAAHALVHQLDPQLVLITGDMVAGQKAGLDYGAMWRSFHRAVTDPLLAAGVLVAPTPGNHDAAPGPAFAKERAEYIAQWKVSERTPKVRFLDGSNFPLYYSFDYGGVLFVSLDAAAVGPLSKQQTNWLELQLQNSIHRTKIVFGHLPVHPFAVQREREILDDRRLGELLKEHDVTAYISGHHHAYYPGAVDGVRHVAMPCLGGGARRLIGGQSVSPAALVILDIQDGMLESLEAVRSPHFDETIARHTLPEQLRHGQHRIVRDDLAGLALPTPLLPLAQADPVLKHCFYTAC